MFPSTGRQVSTSSAQASMLQIAVSQWWQFGLVPNMYPGYWAGLHSGASTYLNTCLGNYTFFWAISTLLITNRSFCAFSSVKQCSQTVSVAVYVKKE